MLHTWSRRGATSSLLVASAAALLTGCSATDGMLSAISFPEPPTTQAPSAMVAPPAGEGEPTTLSVTRQQRDYLDALAAGGVRPSSDLLALSIGSYVCQARAAKQPDQAVWDFVLPLVRSDVRNAHLNSMAPSPAEVDTATAGYIRIATERLC